MRPCVFPLRLNASPMKEEIHQRFGTDRNWEKKEGDLINAWEHAWMSQVATWRYRSPPPFFPRPTHMKEKGLREDEGKKKEKKSFRRSAGRLMDQVNGPSTPDMSSPDVRIPSSPAKHSLFYFRVTLTWSRPPRERVSHATCVCVCVLPPARSLFKLEGFYLIRLPFDFNYWSTTRRVELIRFVSSSFPPDSLSLLVCHVRQQRDRIATTRHPRQYHLLLIDAAIETEHTPTAHY